MTWLFIATVFLVLLVFWRFLNWTLDLVSYGHCSCSRHRWDPYCKVHGQQQAAWNDGEDSSTRKGTGTSSL
jgi:hypothetical protein